MGTVLVLNMGLKSIRAIIFDRDGRKLGSSGIAINTAINDKRVEQDPAEWKDKAVKVIRKAHQEAGRCRIEYITVTTSASCLVNVDRNGDTIGKAFMISDKRAEEEAKYINNLPEFKDVKDRTGLNASASLMLPKILWLKNHKPEQFENARFFLTPNDYLIYLLCGEFVTDYLNASKYHYDMQQKKYPTRLLKTLGIDEKKLPRVLDTGAVVGKITKEMVDLTGLNTDIKVVLTSYDAICSFVGSGVSKEGEASDVSGTVTVFRTVAKKGTNISGGNVYNIPFKQGGYDILGGSNNLGGGLIEWVKQCYYQKEEYPYEVMEKDAAESDVGARGLIFLPYLLGERTPLWNDDARGVFFGLERMHTRKDMTRAVFESAGFVDRTIADAILEAGDVPVDSVRISGGLARVNLVSQIKADIIGKDVMVLSEFETTSSGAAMMVLHSQGEYADLEAAAENFAMVRMIIKPNAENHKKYNYMYELFKETYKTVEPLYKKRMELIEYMRSDREIQIENL